MLDSDVFYWAKLPSDFWERPSTLAIEEIDPLCIIFYLRLVCKTLNSDGFCRDELGKWSVERVTKLTNCKSVNKTKEYIKMLLKVKLLDKLDGCLHISNFENLVGKKTYGAERIKAYRQQQRNCYNVTYNVGTNDTTNVVTQIKKEKSNIKKNKNKELELDTELDIDIELEREEINEINESIVSNTEIKEIKPEGVYSSGIENLIKIFISSSFLSKDDDAIPFVREYLKELVDEYGLRKTARICKHFAAFYNATEHEEEISNKTAYLETAINNNRRVQEIKKSIEDEKLLIAQMKRFGFNNRKEFFEFARLDWTEE